MQTRRVAALFFIILALALMLRAYHLGSENLWSDEFYTLQTSARQTSIELIKKVDTYEINPPLYFLALKQWMHYFGQSEAALRSMSALFGMLNVVLAYLLGKELLGKKPGLITAALMAFSVVQIEFSQEARAYSMLMLFTLASLLALARLAKTGKAKYLAWIALLNTAGLLTHYMMIYIIFIENCVILFGFYKQKALLKRWCASQAATAVLFLPWLPFFIRQMAKWALKWRGTLIGEFGLPAAIGNLGALAFAIPLAALAVLIILLFIIIKRKGAGRTKIRIQSRRTFDKLFLGFTILLSTGYILLLPKIIVPSFINKFTLPFTIFLYLFIASAIYRMEDRKMQAVCIILLVLINAFGITVYHTVQKKEQLKDALRYVEQTIQEGEALLMCDAAFWKSIGYYTNITNEKKYLAAFWYEEDFYQGFNDTRYVQAPLNDSARKEIFEHLKPKNQTAWLVMTHCRKANNVYTTALDSMYSRKAKANFKGVEVYHYT